MRFTLSIEGDASELAALLASVPTELNASKPLPLTIPCGIAAPAQVAAEHTPATTEAAEPTTEAPATQPKATRTRTTKTVEVPAPTAEATTAPAPATEAPAPTTAPAPASGVTLDSLRKEMQSKLAHSDTIVGWLGELGAKNLSTLAPDQYEALHAKLQTLN